MNCQHAHVEVIKREKIWFVCSSNIPVMVSRDLCTPMLIVDRDVAAGVPGFSSAPSELPAHPYPRLARINHPFSRIESVALLTGQTWTWRPSPFLRRRRKLWSRKYRCAQLLDELPPNNTKTTDGLRFLVRTTFIMATKTTPAAVFTAKTAQHGWQRRRPVVVVLPRLRQC